MNTPTLPEVDLDSFEGFTPGPWRWEVALNSKRVHLCGGPPKSGFGKYDLTVMSFDRYGMNSAAPVFWVWTGMTCQPQRADALAVPAQGREHHANWFRLIDHPDAKLLEAAPQLLHLARGQREEIERLRGALQEIVDGTYPPDLSFPKSKCIHGLTSGDECVGCIEEYARAALKADAPSLPPSIDLAEVVRVLERVGFALPTGEYSTLRKDIRGLLTTLKSRIAEAGR